MSICSVVTLNTMAAAYRWDIKLIYTSLKPVALSSCHIHPSPSETLPLATELHRAQPIGSRRAFPLLPLSLSLSKAQRWLRDCSVMKGIQEASGGQTWSNKPVPLWPAAVRTPGMRVCIKRKRKSAAWARWCEAAGPVCLNAHNGPYKWLQIKMAVLVKCAWAHSD